MDLLKDLAEIPQKHSYTVHFEFYTTGGRVVATNEVTQLVS